MLTNEERIAKMHARASDIQRKKRERNTRIIQSASFAFCLTAVIVFAIYVYQIKDKLISATVTDSMSASIFSDSSMLGIIVIAVIAFLLGVSVTVFCFWLKKAEDEKGNGDKK